MATAKTHEPFKLPVLGETDVLDIDAQLRALDDEATAVRLPQQSATHWVDEMVNPQFTKSQRAGTTLLVSGLTHWSTILISTSVPSPGALRTITSPPNRTTRPMIELRMPWRSSATSAGSKARLAPGLGRTPSTG